MCFLIQSKVNREPKVAEKDIKCYKIFRKSDTGTDKRGKPYVKSFFKRFRYRVGVLYELDGYMQPQFSSWRQEDIIEVGLHSYTTIRKAQVYCMKSRDIVYECTIPKGATYYHNSKMREYVSDQIIINKPIVK